MTDRDRLIELVDKAKEEYAGDVTDHTETDYIVETLLNEGAILPPCKVGDYVLWDNGLKDSQPQMKPVIGFHYTSYDLGLRYILEDCQPLINHSGIVGILTKEEAEAELQKEREG